MGVLNVTPDSFSDGGAFLDPGAAYERAVAMVEEGAGVIDIGGESTRPGAPEMSAETELGRVLPVLSRLGPAISVPLSIDTRRAVVARAAIEAGAAIVNDVSGLRHDPAMSAVVRDAGAAVVVMHMQGTPETMQLDPRYDDAVSEIIAWLGERTGDLVGAGIDREKIIVDPGLGFGKRLEDNVGLLNQIGGLPGPRFPRDGRLLEEIVHRDNHGARAGGAPSRRFRGAREMPRGRGRVRAGPRREGNGRFHQGLAGDRARGDAHELL